MNPPLPTHLQGLNPAQQAAVETIDGPLLILAGAGSGKTRVLTRRVAHLLYSGVRPWQILAVTFTNKAAGEMVARVAEMVGSDARDIWVSTFHSACVRILRREAEAAGLSKSFVIYDADDQARLLKQILLSLHIDRKVHPERRFRSDIDTIKNRMLDDVEVEDYAGLGHIHHHTPRVYKAYNQRLRASQAVDFNDLIGLVVKLFKDKPEVLERYQDRFRYLLVDEYQDTNHAQYQLVRLLAAKRRNVAVVGDDDQSIYSFRGADIRNILSFEKDFPEAKVVVLDQNYRSTSRILQAAGAVVALNSARKEKALWTDEGEGDHLRRLVAPTEEAEAARVVDEIQRLQRGGLTAGDVAIIYRTNARSRLFEMALRARRIPFVVVGARRFFERREIRDLMAYLKLVINPDDEMSFLRAISAPRRGVGPKTIERVRAKIGDSNLLTAARAVSAAGGRGAKALGAFVSLIERAAQMLVDQPPGEVVRLIAEESGYLTALRAEGTHEAEGRLQNIQALALDLAGPGEWIEGDAPQTPTERLQEFLDRSSLAAQSDELPDEGGAVTLLTAHLAKGLEFPVVFVVGMVEGAFPHSRSAEKEEDLAEERRLVYVAFTRAQRKLYIAYHSRKRSWSGFEMEVARPSRFLSDIPQELFVEERVVRRAGLRAPLSQAESRRRRETFARRHGISWSADRIPAPPPSDPDEVRVTRPPEGPEEFLVGVRVLHPKLGEGVIQRRSGSNRQLRLVIRFQEYGRKTILPQYARLEIID